MQIDYRNIHKFSKYYEKLMLSQVQKNKKQTDFSDLNTNKLYAYITCLLAKILAVSHFRNKSWQTYA